MKEVNTVLPEQLSFTTEEQEVVDLSVTKWQWMAERNINALESIFNEKSVFVHMGATMTRDQELGVIKDGFIQYKHVEISETCVKFIGTTAILLNRIILTAIVAENEVITPFVVTEVYVKENDQWTLGSLSFTKLITREANGVRKTSQDKTKKPS